LGFFSLFFFCIYLHGSCCVAQGGLKLTILLSQPPGCWDSVPSTTRKKKKIKTISFHSYEVLRIVKIREIESRIVVAGAEEEEEGAIV
jgi:hypothetical protein